MSFWVLGGGFEEFWRERISKNEVEVEWSGVEEEEGKREREREIWFSLIVCKGRESGSGLQLENG